MRLSRRKNKIKEIVFLFFLSTSNLMSTRFSLENPSPHPSPRGGEGEGEGGFHSPLCQLVDMSVSYESR